MIMTKNEDVGFLRTEIIESQKTRTDLLKYKLFIIAIIGSIGLGISETKFNIRNIDYILYILPFVCIYIDLLCYHNTIRILVIASFLTRIKNEYEMYINLLGTDKKDGNRYYFNLEDIILRGSSLFIALLLIVYGISKYAIFSDTQNITALCIFVFSGFAGTIIPFLSYKAFKNRVIALEKVSNKLEKKSY